MTTFALKVANEIFILYLYCNCSFKLLLYSLRGSNLILPLRQQFFLEISADQKEALQSKHKIHFSKV